MLENTENSHEINNSEAIGSVKIADDVIEAIAALAATDVDGVASMAGNITNELVAKLGVRNLNKGVKLNIDGEKISVSLSINVVYGFSIPEVAAVVQEKVKTQIENMTGMKVTDIAVNIAGIDTADHN